MQGRGQVISFDAPDNVSVTPHRIHQSHDKLCTPNIVVRDVEEAEGGASIGMYQVSVSPSRQHTSWYVLQASKGRRGRVASLSGRHRRVLGEIDPPILSTRHCCTRVCARPSRQRSDSDEVRSCKARRGNRSARRGIGDIDDVRAIWNNGYAVLSLASVRQPSDEIDKRMRFANSTGVIPWLTFRLRALSPIWCRSVTNLWPIKNSSVQRRS